MKKNPAVEQRLFLNVTDSFRTAPFLKECSGRLMRAMGYFISDAGRDEDSVRRYIQKQGSEGISLLPCFVDVKNFCFFKFLKITPAACEHTYSLKPHCTKVQCQL